MSSSKRAARLLRKLKDRQDELAQALSEADEIPNPIHEIFGSFSITEGSVTIDSEAAGSFTWDEDNWDTGRWR